MGDIYKERRMKTKCYTYIGVILASCVLLNGCGTTSKNSDPFEKTNRKFYAFNDAIDKNFVQPVAETYVKITPVFFGTESQTSLIIWDISTPFQTILQVKLTMRLKIQHALFSIPL